MTKLIINADDYGMTESCTKAIIEAFKEKKITSTTICSNGYYFNQAVELIFKNGIENKIGIHLNLTEGEPLTDEIKQDKSFCNNDGVFDRRLNQYRLLTKIQKRMVFNELIAQIQRVKSAGVSITHIDSHHHIHTALNITPIVIEVARHFNIEKIRICRNLGKIPKIKLFLKNLYNKYYFIDKFITTNLFGSINDINHIKRLEENTSIEIMVHPDYDSNGLLINLTGRDINHNPVGKPFEISRELFENYKFCSYYDI